MNNDKGYKDLMFAIVKQAVVDLTQVLCEREYARRCIENDNSYKRSYSALSTYIKCNNEIKRLKKFLNSDFVSLLELDGSYLVYLIYGICEDANYYYYEIIK